MPDDVGDLTDRRIRVSVCLAAFNGAAHIEDQLRSVLTQLGPDDEVVVVDDASTDNTCAVVSGVGDPRIILSHNETNLGYVRTFERALGRARGAYLLLCDQDDLWVPGRLVAMVTALDRTAVVATSVAVLGEPLRPPRWPLRDKDSQRYAANLAATLVGVRWYFGCAMGIRRDALDLVLPFPAYLVESHDLWVAIVANTCHEMTHLEHPSVARRLHDANQTPTRWRSLRRMVTARWMLARCLVEARRRVTAA